MNSKRVFQFDVVGAIFERKSINIDMLSNEKINYKSLISFREHTKKISIIHLQTQTSLPSCRTVSYYVTLTRFATLKFCGTEHDL